MVKYKIVIRPQSILGNAVIPNNLSNLNGYLTHDNSIVEKGILVNEDNVNEFLNDPNNASVIDRFKKYIREYTNELEFKEIYYKPSKVAPILNDYYNEEVRFNSEANQILILDALKGTQEIHYTNNNFDFLNNKRIGTNESKLIDVLSANTIYKDYYIDVAIGTKEDSLYGTDYSSYFKGVSEDGVFYVNSFVDLNQKTDPFEYWTNDRPTKKWKSAPKDPELDRVEGFEDVTIKLEEKLPEIKDKNSLKHQTQLKKIAQSRKVADKVRAKYERKKSSEDARKKRKS
tara:strand:+ start:1162 stop:2022 length:861 start_codon:yes stop_codon:yes gene_type:complete